MNVRRAGLKAMGMAAALTLAAVSIPGAAQSHCDGLDGPVVTAARSAIEQGDVTGALIWVRPEDEAEIRTAFQRTLTVRKQSPQARELADLYFFETLVRIHRLGEGAPYTGLKPAGRDLGPAIPAADRALETGDVEPLAELLVDRARDGVRRHFAEAQLARTYPAGDVTAGRTYIGAYVPFIHYVERLYQAANTEAKGHEAELGTAPAHAE